MILETLVLSALYFQCGENVHPDILHAIVKTESSSNPYVIANVSDGESYKFETREEAVAMSAELLENGKTFSAGLMQIYSKNFESYDLNNITVFDNCKNIKAGAKILKKCYLKSVEEFPDNPSDYHLENAMSCYYSGNFKRGFKKDEGLNSSYVERVRSNVTNIYEVPSFYNYNGSDFQKGASLSSNKKEGLKDVSETKEEVFLLNKNWDVFNDYEIKK